MIGMVVVIVLFIFLGIYLSMGKGSFLIAGFNTLPKEEKEKYDEVALCKFMGKIMFLLSFSMLFWVMSELYDLAWLDTLGYILFFGIILFMIIYTKTGNRFKK